MGGVLWYLSQVSVQTASISSAFCLGSMCSVYSQVQPHHASQRTCMFQTLSALPALERGLGFKP